MNPDPKAHPIHPPIPVQPIHEGTDPKRPVTTEPPAKGPGTNPSTSPDTKDEDAVDDDTKDDDTP